MGAGRRSVVWEFFEDKEDNVICKICLRPFNGTSASSNLRRHLIRRHKLQWQLATNRTISNDLISKTLMSTDDHDTSSEVTSIQKQSVRQSDTDEGDIKPAEEWLEEADIISTSSYQLIKKKQPRKRTKPIQNDKHRNKNLKTTNQEKQFNDVYDSFGVYVASKIRDIGDTKTKVNVQQLISTILWQAEYGIFNNFEAVNKVMSTMASTPANEVAQANIVISYEDQQDGNNVQTEQNVL